MMHLNNSIRYKRSFVNINPQSNTDFTQVTCTVHFYYNGDQRNQIVKPLRYLRYKFLKNGEDIEIFFKTYQQYILEEVLGFLIISSGYY
jgi:hypothetical protein